MAQQRLKWPDIARGISILGVIVLHTSLAIPEARETWLSQANEFLDPLRMPLFFLVSGLFSAKVFRYSFSELFKYRLWFLLIPYLIWVPLELAAYQAVLKNDYDAAWPPASYFLNNVITGATMIWFLYALVLFNIVLWCLRRLPGWLAVTASFALPALLLPFHEHWHMIAKSVVYLPVFVFSAYFSTQVHRFTAHARRLPVIIGSFVAYLVAYFGVHVWNSSRDDSVYWHGPGEIRFGEFELDLGIRVLQHVFSLPAALVLSVLLTLLPRVSSVLLKLGRNTLPLYVGHHFGIMAMFHYQRIWVVDVELDAISRFGHFPFENTLFWGFCAILGALAVGAILKYLTRIPRLRWLLYPPPLSALSRRE